MRRSITLRTFAIASLVTAAAFSANLAGCASSSGLDSADEAAPEKTGSTSQAATAAIGDWNSCLTFFGYCVEQWGSFAASCDCGGEGDCARYYVAGKRCKNIGGIVDDSLISSGSGVVYDCHYGRFSDYEWLQSTAGYTASTYACSVPAPVASNVTLTMDTSYDFTLSYSWSQAYGMPDQSKFSWTSCPTGSTTGCTTLPSTTSSITLSDGYLGASITACVTPYYDNENEWDIAVGGYDNNQGTEVCATIIPGGPPVASNVTASISGDMATGSYQYTDTRVTWPTGTTESGTTFLWQRGTSPTGGTVTDLDSTITHTLSTDDYESYLRFCVTPKNATYTGSQTCSSWMSVGPLFIAYQDDSYGGTTLNFAYRNDAYGKCFNFTDYGFNDELSSLIMTAASAGPATVWVYSDVDCSGTVHTVTAPAGLNTRVPSATSYWGASFNDAASSFKVTY